MNFTDYFYQVQSTLKNVNDVEIGKAIRMLGRARMDDSFAWIVGNGGSAATASHFANDLEKMCGIRAISIPDLVPNVMAHGNDEGWDKMFSNVVREYARDKDVLIAISCGGNSINVVEAAKQHPAQYLIVLTGDSEESMLYRMGAHAMICVPNSDIKVQEDVHLVICHGMIEMLRVR